VFGESLLNDGVAIVLYQVFEKFIQLGNDDITGRTIGLAFASFIVVAGGGLIIGVFFGIITAFVSRFTHIMHELEPLIVLMIAYASYLVADMLEMSGIIAVVFAGVTMRWYVETNMNPNTLKALHVATKMLAVLAEMTIFVVLGIYAATANWADNFHWRFSLIVLAFCTIWRPVVVVVLTGILNHFRDHKFKITFKDQLIMSLSGLRGGIAFSLMVMSYALEVQIGKQAKDAFILTTIFIVFFTVFVQGSLVEPIVNQLSIEKQASETETKDIKLNIILHDKVLNYTSDGITAICGECGVSSLHNYHRIKDPPI